MIQVDNLEVTLPSRAGKVNILRGIDLQIAAGEKLGIIGPSGSGKTTLLMVLAGLEPPSKGHVSVAGHDYGAMDEDALARFRRHHVGIVFQSFHLVPTMTARENVALPLELAGEKMPPRALPNCLTRSGWGRACRIIPCNYQAASSSALRWRVLWRPIRKCCLPMSRPAILTNPPASKLWR